MDSFGLKKCLVEPLGAFGTFFSPQTNKQTYKRTIGGQHSTEVAFALPTQPSQAQISAFVNFFTLDVSEIYRQQHCLERVDSPK